MKERSQEGAAGGEGRVKEVVGTKGRGQDEERWRPGSDADGVRLVPLIPASLSPQGTSEMI